MQKTSYKIEKDKPKEKEILIKPICLIVILMSQLKYELIEDVTEPMNYIELRINDYEDNKELYKKVINSAIDELKLNSEFKSK